MQAQRCLEGSQSNKLLVDILHRNDGLIKTPRSARHPFGARQQAALVMVYHLARGLLVSDIRPCLATIGVRERFHVQKDSNLFMYLKLPRDSAYRVIRITR
jgi:hypothetical protein